MRESVSIIFPVRDCQAEVTPRIEKLLDWLCDLSHDVQIIVVDDQSHDATPEVLDDMRRRYPQVNVIRNVKATGPSQSVESVLCLARGDFIFLHPSYDPVDHEEILQLWQLRKDEQLVIARAATRVRRIDQQLLQRLQDWGRKLEEHWPVPRAVVNGLQMMRKDAVKSLSKVKDSSEELEVTHQSHRRITAPKFIQGSSSTNVVAPSTPTAPPSTVNAVNPPHRSPSGSKTPSS
jgi:glycosyltransferase involved in cell wall biosynthesis